MTAIQTRKEHFELQLRSLQDDISSLSKKLSVAGTPISEGKKNLRASFALSCISHHNLAPLSCWVSHLNSISYLQRDLSPISSP